MLCIIKMVALEYWTKIAQLIPIIFRGGNSYNEGGKVHCVVSTSSKKTSTSIFELHSPN